MRSVPWTVSTTTPLTLAHDGTDKRRDLQHQGADHTQCKALALRYSKQRREPGSHHVTVIEEAHKIVGRTGTAHASEEIVDPKAFAAEYVSRMLAELRALGEGIVIAD